MDGADLLFAALAVAFGGAVVHRVNVLSKRVDAAHQRINALRDFVLRARGDDGPPEE